jgi:hypothetical protein
MSFSSVDRLFGVERNWADPIHSTLAEGIGAVKVRRGLKKAPGAAAKVGSYGAGRGNSGWGQLADEVEFVPGSSRSLVSGKVFSTPLDEPTDDGQGPKS